MRQKLGQHFLQDPTVAKKIAGALEIQTGEVIIEIGPGHGELTEALLTHDSRLIVIERDPELAEHVRQRFGDRIEVIEGDALEVLPRLSHDYALHATPYTLTGNIPYYLTGFLFRTISELEHKPRRTLFMIQKEVAERITAVPPRMNRLAAAVQYWAEPKLLFSVGRKEFLPPPEVDSAVIRLDTLRQAEGKLVAGPEDDARYYKLLHILFQQPRKTVLNNLAAGFPEMTKERLAAMLIDVGTVPEARPQDLSVENIRRLADLCA